MPALRIVRGAIMKCTRPIVTTFGEVPCGTCPDCKAAQEPHKATCPDCKNAEPCEWLDRALAESNNRGGADDRPDSTLGHQL